MIKTSFERELEKQRHQAKQLAEKQRRENDKQLREEKRMAAQEARRQQAASIVTGQPVVEGLRIMDKTSETMLEILLKQEREENNKVNYKYDCFPPYIYNDLSLNIEKLVQYGMVSLEYEYLGGGVVYLLEPALCYFEDKKQALIKQEENRKVQPIHQQIITNTGNLVIGNVINSSLNIDNSIHEIEKMIEEKGNEDKEELQKLLEEVKELIENIEASRNVPKQKSLMQRLSDHFEKHGWFYGAVSQLLGTKVIDLLGK